MGSRQRRLMRFARHRSPVFGVISVFLSGCASLPERYATAPLSPASRPVETAGAASPMPDAASASPATLEKLRERLRQFPTDPQAHYEMGMALRETAPADAARHWREALKSDARSEAYKPLADLYEQAGYKDRLIELLERRVAAVPGDGESVGRLAILYVGVARRKDARQLIEKLAALPADDAVLNARARFYYIADDFPKAIASMEALASRHPEDSYLRYRLSEVQRAGSQYAQAEQTIRQAIGAKPNEGIYYRQLAHILATAPSHTRATEAEGAARKAIELGENSIDTRYWLALALVHQGKPDALKVLRQIADEDVTYEKTAFYLARIYRKSGKRQESEQLLKLHDLMFKNQRKIRSAERNLEAKPTPQLYLTVADFQVHLKDPGIAIALLRQGVNQFPTDKALKDALRRALNQVGRRTEAKVVL